MSSKEKPIAFCSVFPKVGIARVGDSDDYFVGPEAPGLETAPEGGFKDPLGQVKRQAARFHVYAFDAEGGVVEELTAKNTKSMSWRVTVANKKAAWNQFDGASKAQKLFENTLDDAHVPPLRNNDWPSDRRALVIKATAAVSGVSEVSAPLAGSIFAFKEATYLGELRTDVVGRLLFLGGHGKSRPISDDDRYLINHYANNDRWCDDTCDGVVDVEVTLLDGTVLPVRGRSWVIVAPPDFAPHTDNVVTLYDVMEEVALNYGLPWHLSAPVPQTARSTVSFVDEVFPILTRIVGYQWVTERSLRGHGPGKRGDFLGKDQLGALANAQDPKGTALRQHILSVLRNPNLSDDAAKEQANLNFMPQLSGDEGDEELGDPTKWLTLTKRQYETMQLWAQNKFSGFSNLKELRAELARRAASVKSVEELPLSAQPFALTTAAMMPCVGGPFFPGIEITSICRSRRLYGAAFEIAADLEPGDVTKWMAVPWQADFYECNTHWWPAQRPDAVVSEFDYQEAAKEFPIEDAEADLRELLFPRKQWDRGIGSDRVFRPIFNFADPDEGDTTTAYAAACQEALGIFARDQWTNRGRRWQFPETKDGESLNRYKFRLRECFDHYGSTGQGTPGKWPFVLPDSPPAEDPGDYRARLIKAFTVFIDSLVPNPTPTETLDDYSRRLTDDQSPWNVFIAGSTQVGYETRRNYRGDNEMVRKWNTLGFVIRVPNIADRILVETGRGKYDGRKDRDYFYMMLNWESYPDFEPKAKEMAYQFLQAAKDLQRTKQFKSDPENSVYEFFEYSPSAFEARLEEIYERFAAKMTAPPEDWTPERLVSRILQLAPFNQLDGAWLRYATDAGPIRDVNSLLFNIWSDETGNGDPALNHANLYTALMQSVGLYLPDLRSRAYADNPAILDSAYTNPLFELLISQFSKEFFPEILGMTLQLEWEVLGLWVGVKRLEAKHFNSQFYRMHIGIDNASEGHGAQAKRAVQQYLDFVRAESGPIEATRQWERIWTGYVAFETTGDISEDFANMWNYPPMIEERMAALISDKKHYAQRNHSNLQPFGPNRMNDWFEDPIAFLDQIANSDYITKGDPDNSKLLSNRMSYSGPMYKVFTTAELKLWADWVRWLGKEYESVAPVGPADPGAIMRQLVERLTPIAVGVPAHMTTMLGGRSVADWFKAGATEIMSALADPQNGWIVPFSSATSKFITNLLPGAPGMEEAIRGVVIGGQDGVTIVKGWIDAGCPVPGQFAKAQARGMVVPAVTVPEVRPAARGRRGEYRRATLHRRQIFGQDAVH